MFNNHMPAVSHWQMMCNFVFSSCLIVLWLAASFDITLLAEATLLVLLHLFLRQSIFSLSSLSVYLSSELKAMNQMHNCISLLKSPITVNYKCFFFHYKTFYY